MTTSPGSSKGAAKPRISMLSIRTPYPELFSTVSSQGASTEAVFACAFGSFGASVSGPPSGGRGASANPGVASVRGRSPRHACVPKRSHGAILPASRLRLAAPYAEERPGRPCPAVEVRRGPCEPWRVELDDRVDAAEDPSRIFQRSNRGRGARGPGRLRRTALAEETLYAGSQREEVWRGRPKWRTRERRGASFMG
jgi:hypothetical protein